MNYICVEEATTFYADRCTDKHDEANSSFFKFFERV